MQRLRRGRAVLNHSDADVVRAGIAAIGLLACKVAAGHYAHAGLLPQPLGHDLAAAVLGDIEPEKESAGRTLVVVAATDDLVGEIELGGIESAIFLHMDFIAIGGDATLRNSRKAARKRRSPAAKPTRRPGRFDRFDSE